MSNMTQQTAEAIQHAEPRQSSEAPIASGDMNAVRPVPRITVQAFCQTENIAQVLEMASKDRRMAKAHVKVHMGGISAAVDFYSGAPTPNLIVVESKLIGEELLTDLGRLAEVCDGETKVVVIGHQNDITMYRELIANGVSEYLVAPVSMADFMQAVSEIFVSPENGPIGKVLAFIGAKGGVGSST
ncbi:MAG: CtpF protein, partial [Rhizobiaceae bacterium]